jgi:hypothetical protein
MAARSKAHTVFNRSNTGIVVSNPARGMEVCPRFSVLCRPMWVMRRVDPPSKESYQMSKNRFINFRNQILNRKRPEGLIWIKKKKKESIMEWDGNRVMYEVRLKSSWFTLFERDRHRTSTKSRLGVIRWGTRENGGGSGYGIFQSILPAFACKYWLSPQEQSDDEIWGEGSDIDLLGSDMRQVLELVTTVSEKLLLPR